MDLSQYSTEELMQMAGIQPKTDLSSYSTEDLMKMANIQPKAQQITPEQRAWQIEQGKNLLKDIGIDTSRNTINNAFADGFQKGYIGGAERLGSGATFGLTDWVGDKLGTGVKERRQELENMNGTIKGINLGLDIVGGVPTGGAMFKGAMTGAKAVPYVGKALKYAVPTATGAISGGLYSGFENDSLDAAKQGALVGGLMGGVLDVAGKGVSKLWSASHKIDGIKRGFSNAVESSKGTKLLKRAVKESDDIAEQVYAKAPEALDEINSRAISKLDDAVKGGVDVKGEMSKAKKSYADFIDEQKANQIVQGKETFGNDKADLYSATQAKTKDGTGIIVDKFTNNNWFSPSKKIDHSIDLFYPETGATKRYNESEIEKWLYGASEKKGITPKATDLLPDANLSNNQRNALNLAWKQGANSLKKGEAVGSLKHIDEIKKSLNKMISESMTDSKTGIGKDATGLTTELQELKGYLKDTMNNSGLADINKEYARAKGLESAFNQGLNFKPNAIKTRNIRFNTPEEKSAFAQGLVEQIKINPDTKNIAGKARDLTGALKYALGDKSKDVLKSLNKNSQSYERVSSILKNAEKRLMTEEPIQRGLIREKLESLGSMLGDTFDYAKRASTADSARRAANYLLNPELKVRQPLFLGIQKYLPTSSAIGTTDLLKGE